MFLQHQPLSVEFGLLLCVNWYKWYVFYTVSALYLCQAVNRDSLAVARAFISCRKQSLWQVFQRFQSLSGLSVSVLLSEATTASHWQCRTVITRQLLSWGQLCDIWQDTEWYCSIAGLMWIMFVYSTITSHRWEDVPDCITLVGQIHQRFSASDDMCRAIKRFDVQYLNKYTFLQRVGLEA